MVELRRRTAKVGWPGCYRTITIREMTDGEISFLKTSIFAGTLLGFLGGCFVGSIYVFVAWGATL